MEQLREYQAEAVERAVSVLTGAKAVALRAPTGAGKTVMAQAIAERLNARPLAIAHTAELVSQWRERGTDAITVHKLLADITLADNYDLLIVDEAHHYTRNLWEAVITQAPCKVLGLSATFSRSTVYHGYEHLYADCVSTGTYQELRDGGYLVPAQVMLPGILKPWEGESLGFEYMATLDENRHARNLQGLIDWLVPELQNKKSIIYVATKAEARRLASRLTAYGLDAGVAIGGDSSALATFDERGPGTVLVTVQLVAEGIDVPTCNAIVFARFVGSYVAYRQAIGRATRPDGGKEMATIYDYCGSALHHGHPMNEDYVTLRATDLGAAPMCPTCLIAVYVGNQCPQCGALLHIAESRPRKLRCPACRGGLTKDSICKRCQLVAHFTETESEGCTHFRYGGLTFNQLGEQKFGGIIHDNEYEIDLAKKVGTINAVQKTGRSVKAILAWLVANID
jgi:superfamily II DNA or RNA helicase